MFKGYLIWSVQFLIVSQKGLQRVFYTEFLLVEFIPYSAK